jgi:hypothetical protein
LASTSAVLAHPPEEANSRLETTRHEAYNDWVAITVIYEHKWPCAGEWYAIGGAEGFAAFRLDHVHVGQELQYEQGEDIVYWRISKVLQNGKFIAVPIHREGYANEPRHFQLVENNFSKNASSAEDD